MEIDEQWSFVGNKRNPQWLWSALDTSSRQVLAIHIGPRTRSSAEALLSKLPEEVKKSPLLHRSVSSVLRSTYLKQRHRAKVRGGGHTNHLERLHLTLRQRCSRLVRKTLSFSKKLKNHIGMIKYFICDYNFRLACPQ